MQATIQAMSVTALIEEVIGRVDSGQFFDLVDEGWIAELVSRDSAKNKAQELCRRVLSGLTFIGGQSERMKRIEDAAREHNVNLSATEELEKAQAAATNGRILEELETLLVRVLDLDLADVRGVEDMASRLTDLEIAIRRIRHKIERVMGLPDSLPPEQPVVIKPLSVKPTAEGQHGVTVQARPTAVPFAITAIKYVGGKAKEGGQFVLTIEGLGNRRVANCRANGCPVVKLQQNKGADEITVWVDRARIKTNMTFVIDLGPLTSRGFSFKPPANAVAKRQTLTPPGQAAS